MMISAGESPKALYCPQCGTAMKRSALRCPACGADIKVGPIPLYREAAARTEGPRRRGLAILGTAASLVLLTGGYAFQRYHTATSDLGKAHQALLQDHWKLAEAEARDAKDAWPNMDTQGVEKRAQALGASAHYFNLALTLYHQGHYGKATADFRKVAAGDSHYPLARKYVADIITGEADLSRVQALSKAVVAISDDITSYTNDYNSTVDYANQALSAYQNGISLFGYSPSVSFANNVANGQSAFSSLQQDASQLSTDVSALSTALGLISATPTLRNASLANIESAAQGLVNNSSQIDTAFSDELSSFQAIANGSATVAYGLSSDVSAINQQEAAWSRNQNNLSNAVSHFAGFASGVVGRYLGLQHSLTQEFQSLSPAS
ncbi:zinc ribbon domain-containing protein [Sulfobacillus harzensis]|uniref:Zinc-ribbon domain-containing protein n=1 Tax=Sulfobacillus harzensis TaxID=2729629 RepID=A0A7Y0L8V1_9FIRM|nr:zinc ribbon domain-containing protein [Sulfobacillus harzensis]NMP25087.1 hypothetical protein [Sulfobacillus harzensis]